jgi:serine/threonine protein kinase
MTGDLVGTLRYMSPEQTLCKRVLVDHRTDIYSLGATLYELLTLQPVFAGEDRQELLRQIAFEDPRTPRLANKAVPHELATIVLKAIEKNPQDRYRTAGEMSDDLRRWLEDKAIKARAPTLRQRGLKWARRNRPVVGAIAVGLLLVLVSTTGFGLWSLQQQAETERKIELAVQEATIYQGESKWALALAAVKHAETLFVSNGSSAKLERPRNGVRAGKRPRAIFGKRRR